MNLDSEINKLVAHDRNAWVMEANISYEVNHKKPDLSADLFPEIYDRPTRDVRIWTIFDERNFPLPTTIRFENPGIYSISGERTGIIGRKPAIYTAMPERVLHELKLRLAENANCFDLHPHPGVMPRGWYSEDELSYWRNDGYGGQKPLNYKTS